MVLSAILWTVAFQQQAVDFEVRATSLTNALGKLSRIAGVTYRPDAPMANEIVCVQAHKVPLADLLTRIAEATGCEWKDEDGARILYRPAETTQKYLAAEYKARVAYLKKLLDSQAKLLAKIGTPYERAEEFVKAVKTLQDKIDERPMGINLDGPRLASPASKLVLQLAVELGPELLAEIPDGETYTFSDHPTRAQRPLGPGAQRYIRDYVETEAQLGNLLPDRPEETRSAMKGIYDDIYASAKMTDGVGKVLFTAKRLGRGIFFGATAYTEKGKRRSWGFSSSYQMGDDAYTRQQNAGISDKPIWIDLPPASAEFCDAEEPEPNVASFGEGRPLLAWSAMPASVKKALQNPEEIDPLSLAVTDGCFGLADQNSVPMVAYLSDGAEVAGRLGEKGGRLNLARFKALIENSGHYVEAKNGWLVMRPWYPLYPARYRLSRAAWGKLAKAAVAAKRIDLEPYCRFHFEAGATLNTSSVARLYTKTLTRWGIGAIPYVESFPHEPFAALGSLNPNQWQLLRQGQELRFGQMPMPQRTRGEDWMMKDPYYLKVDPDANVPDLFHDWTEYAPNGLPPGATVSLEIKTGYVYRQMTMIKYPDGSIREGSLNGERGNSAEQIAKDFARGGYYKSFESVMQDMRRGKGQVSQRTDYTFRFRLLPTHMIEETFNGALTDSKTLPYDEWPESMRQAFEETFKREFQKKGGE